MSADVEDYVEKGCLENVSCKRKQLVCTKVGSNYKAIVPSVFS